MRMPAGLIARARTRLRGATQDGRLARVMIGRLVAAATERLGRAHAVGLLAGAGAGVLLAVLSSQLGPVDRSRAAARHPARVAPRASVAASPTRFALARHVVRRRNPSRGGRAYYRETSSRHVPTATEVRFLALYRQAAGAFGVSWRLIASIHRQETAFSTVPGTYHGLNAFGCCAGPMQFNVTNGPVTTWELYRGSFRHGARPRRYPHRTRMHPSVYDDFDAIMAAGALLRDSGATDTLDGGSWSAAYGYYGHDPFGVGYASQVLARAQGWELGGFCVNCPVDASLVAVLDDVYGVDARRRLRAAARHGKRRRHKRRHADRAAETTAADDAPPRLPVRGPEAVATPQTPAPEPPAATTPAPATTTPPPPPAQPAGKPCTPVTRLLGCGG